jgi:hypothetical protein
MGVLRQMEENKNKKNEKIDNGRKKMLFKEIMFSDYCTENTTEKLALEEQKSRIKFDSYYEIKRKAIAIAKHLRYRFDWSCAKSVEMAKFQQHKSDVNFVVLKTISIPFYKTDKNMALIERILVNQNNEFSPILQKVFFNTLIGAGFTISSYSLLNETTLSSITFTCWCTEMNGTWEQTENVETEIVTSPVLETDDENDVEEEIETENENSESTNEVVDIADDEEEA